MGSDYAKSFVFETQMGVWAMNTGSLTAATSNAAMVGAQRNTNSHVVVGDMLHALYFADVEGCAYAVWGNPGGPRAGRDLATHSPTL